MNQEFKFKRQITNYIPILNIFLKNLSKNKPMSLFHFNLVPTQFYVRKTNFICLI